MENWFDNLTKTEVLIGCQTLFVLKNLEAALREQSKSHVSRKGNFIFFCLSMKLDMVSIYAVPFTSYFMRPNK